MEQAVSSSEAPRRFNTVLITAFAFAAVLLAVLGIYSVIAFSWPRARRRNGHPHGACSQRAGIVRLILESGAKLAAIRLRTGTGRRHLPHRSLLRSLLFGVSPFDPLVLVLAAVGIVLLALSASALPAMRAASVDPMQALRGQ